MNAHRFNSLIAVFALACFLLVAWSVPAEAQKKQKPKTQTKEQAKQAPKEQPKEEVKEAEEKTEEVTPAPGATPGSAALPNKFIDVLKQYIGQKTNLGILKKFAGDYIIFEEELTQTLVPLTSIQSAKLVKDDETTPAQLEIKLISRD